MRTSRRHITNGEQLQESSRAQLLTLTREGHADGGAGDGKGGRADCDAAIKGDGRAEEVIIGPTDPDDLAAERAGKGGKETRAEV